MYLDGFLTDRPTDRNARNTLGHPSAIDLKGSGWRVREGSGDK